jgi:hypothetical protein
LDECVEISRSLSSPALNCNASLSLCRLEGRKNAVAASALLGNTNFSAISSFWLTSLSNWQTFRWELRREIKCTVEFQIS